MPPLAIVWLLVVAWLPGAVLFRAPAGDRDRRAALPAEERLFWAVVLSLTISLLATLLLATLGRYTFERLIAADLLFAAATAAASRFRLRLGSPAAPPGAAAIVPVLLLVLAGWRFFPPAEYVMGGKDPGTYLNEGIQIAQRGSLVIRDEVVKSVPPELRDIFFPSHQNPNYYGIRFMGFFIQDPDNGTVVGQFPHLFPASIAIGYGIDGLTGARRATGFWAALGVLAVYFAGVRLVGRPAAAAASALLALHVLQVWYARYPNSEVMLQALLFAALLAADRALVEGDRFFGAVAGVLLGLMLWLRFDVVLAYAAVGAAALLGIPRRRQLPWTLIVPMGLLSAAALVYLVTLMTGYSYYPLGFTRDWVLVPLLAAAAVLVGVLFWARRPARAAAIERYLPLLVVAAAVAAAGYAWFFRTEAGRTALHDALAFRTFGLFYLTVPGVVAALAGFSYITLQKFWRSPALLLAITAFSVFFFYKIRVVPEHFWMGRRFLAVILPGALLFVTAIALWKLEARPRLRSALSAAIGIVFLVLLGSRYARMADPVLPHVEYAGIIPKLEALAGSVNDRDLLVVESRDASDIHVLGLPLAYIYARNVLVLNNAVPDKRVFGAFLQWAATKYARVLFLGSGGTDLLSRDWSVQPLASDRFTIPEYETTPFTAYPRGARPRKVDYRVYAFGPPRERREPFDLDVGIWDDLHLVRFHAMEESDGRTMRWTSRTSYVSIPSIAPDDRTITIWMNDGGRPPNAAPAEVTVYLEDRPLGTAAVTTGFNPYDFAIPPDLAADTARDGNAQLRLVSTLWNPHEVLGSGDDRQLGVMVDRIRVQ